MRIYSEVFSQQCKAAVRFEQAHEKTICDFNFKKGALVLIQNMAIEKALNKKMRPRYLGPMIVVS